MDRRQFVAAAGSAGLLGLSACGGSGDSPPLAPPPPPPPPTAAPDWSALRAAVSGAVLLPGDAGFALAAPVFNAAYDATVPQAVVRCTSTGDVVAALAFARQYSLAVTPRSGGHGYTGNSTTTGLVIDIGEMAAVVVGSGTATIGAGAKLVDVYDQLSSQGVCIPSGNCPTIGIAGITQGGGIGMVDRAYGLTCDGLVAAEVVLADGSVVDCDAFNHADLFWALRGGGGGNFGIVTSLTFDTFATQDVVSFGAVFAWADAPALVAAWQAWPQTLPDTLWASLIIASAPAIQVSGLFLGSQADFTTLWTQFLAAAGVTPTAQQVQPRSFRNAMLASCYAKTVSQCHLASETPDGQVARNTFAATSDFFDAALPAEGIQALLDAISAQPASGLMALLDLMGGAIAQVAPDATAFVHRNALFSAQYYVQKPIGVSDAIVDQCRSLVSGARAAMSAWSSGEAYQNYLDPNLVDWQAAYYGANYARLVQVKAAYDPTQVFRPLQGIPPA